MASANRHPMKPPGKGLVSDDVKNLTQSLTLAELPITYTFQYSNYLKRTSSIKSCLQMCGYLQASSTKQHIIHYQSRKFSHPVRVLCAWHTTASYMVELGKYHKYDNLTNVEWIKYNRSSSSHGFFRWRSQKLKMYPTSTAQQLQDAWSEFFMKTASGKHARKEILLTCAWTYH